MRTVPNAGILLCHVLIWARYPDRSLYCSPGQLMETSINPNHGPTTVHLTLTDPRAKYKLIRSENKKVDLRTETPKPYNAADVRLGEL